MATVLSIIVREMLQTSSSAETETSEAKIEESEKVVVARSRLCKSMPYHLCRVVRVGGCPVVVAQW